MVKRAIQNVTEELSSIYDIFSHIDTHSRPQATNILVTGEDENEAILSSVFLLFLIILPTLHLAVIRATIIPKTKCLLFIVSAGPGMGKTCSMAKLALDWQPGK